jgi:recombination protein U
MTDVGLVPQQSTVDFIGVYSYNGIGRGIAFDAKATKKKTSFPLANIKSHQLLFLDYWESVGGLAFFFIQFEDIHKEQAYIVPLALIHKYWDDTKARKSIPFKVFDSKWLVDINDYLKDYIK